MNWEGRERLPTRLRLRVGEVSCSTRADQFKTRVARCVQFRELSVSNSRHWLDAARVLQRCDAGALRDGNRPAGMIGLAHGKVGAGVV